MGASALAQIGIYTGKQFRLFKTEKGWKVIVFAAIIAVMVSAVMGSQMFVYDLDTQRGAFTLISACIWVGIFNSIQSICKERAIIKREHRSGLSIPAYILSHMIYQAVICLVETLVILLISMIFIDYPAGSALFLEIHVEYFITFFLVTYAADVLGLAISAIVKSPTTAMTVMPFILIIQLIFAGLIFPLNGATGTIANVTLSKWGLNATCISADYNELVPYEKMKMRYTVWDVCQEKGLVLTEEQLDTIADEVYTDSDDATYDHTFSNLALQWLVLILHTLIYTGVAMVSLSFVDRDKR